MSLRNRSIRGSHIPYMSNPLYSLKDHIPTKYPFDPHRNIAPTNIFRFACHCRIRPLGSFSWTWECLWRRLAIQLFLCSTDPASLISLCSVGSFQILGTGWGRNCMDQTLCFSCPAEPCAYTERHVHIKQAELVHVTNVVFSCIVGIKKAVLRRRMALWNLWAKKSRPLARTVSLHCITHGS